MFAKLSTHAPPNAKSFSGLVCGVGRIAGVPGVMLSASVLFLSGCNQLISQMGSEASSSFLTHTVTTEELLVTVTEEGNVESASNVDIKCQVAGGSSILWIVPDGSTVKQGDKLVELDASTLEDQINTQRIAYEKALATKLQSEKTFAVAEISVEEYLEGTFKKEQQDADALITISLENLRSAENAYEFSEKLFRKGYVSQLELESAKFAVERAELELESARTAKLVLEKFTKAKTLKDLESQRDNAEAQMKSDAAAYNLEEARLKRLEDQLKNCTIVAPQDGMVVYANERGGRFGQSEATIEEGAAVRERQTILRLPDLARMQVKVNVHESKVDQVRSGLRARLKVLDNEYTGTVTSVANQPEPSSFFSGNVKEYATIVSVDGEPAGLRPGMTAEVEILVAHLKSTVTLPVAAVVEQQRKFYCWVDAEPTPERRPLVLGPSNDHFIAIQDGVSAGEVVVLNPRAAVPEARQMDDGEAEEEVDVNARFGGQGTATEELPGGGPGARPGGGPGGPRPGMGGPVNGGGGPGQGPGGGGPRAGRPGGGGGFNPLQFDKDGDGRVTREEAPDRMKENFDRIDSNGDGAIDQSDIDAMRSRFQQRGAGGPGGEGPRGAGFAPGG